MKSSDNNIRRFAVAAAVVGVFLALAAGSGGAQAAPTQAVASAGSLAAQEHDTNDEENQDNTDDESQDNTDDESQDNTDDEDNTDNEDSTDDEEQTDEPTDEPTFTSAPTTDPTDDITEMPTNDADETSAAAPSPLGWVLLGAGVLTAIAAVAVWRRNQSL